MRPDIELDKQPWWRGATIYQIYPRSFQDTNGDGVGDLKGITHRMAYIASLGVDAIWISPFFTSPMADFGYDVSDYCDVDPIFGTLADFDELVEQAHAMGVRVMVDQVYSHSSSDHPWFAESRANRDNAKSDWYVWADPKPEGSPPNNWQAVFGGPAWTWDARRGQYYLHNFLNSQPQLNLHNPQVQDALLGVARFWLDRGVDGFRIDALNFAMHDPLLRDNPPAPPSDSPRTRPFDFQLRLYNQFHPDTVKFLERLRALTDHYEDRFTLAEVGGDEDNVEMKRFTAGNNRLNSAYGFDFLYAEALTPKFVADTMKLWPDTDAQAISVSVEQTEGWPCWAFENHDAPRAVSRWCKAKDQTPFARLKMTLLACLRGNIILYQGEELGLEQDDIPFELLKDPEAIANWPLTLSRDGARTPMPWTTQADEGFTTGDPWLPLSAKNLGKSVSLQEENPASLLHLTRQLLTLKKTHPPLRLGHFKCILADQSCLAFRRDFNNSSILCVFNLSAKLQDWPAQIATSGTILMSVNEATLSKLPPFSAILLEVH